MAKSYVGSFKALGHTLFAMAADAVHRTSKSQIVFSMLDVRPNLIVVVPLMAAKGEPCRWLSVCA